MSTHDFAPGDRVEDREQLDESHDSSSDGGSSGPSDDDTHAAYVIHVRDQPAGEVHLPECGGKTVAEINECSPLATVVEVCFDDVPLHALGDQTIYSYPASRLQHSPGDKRSEESGKMPAGNTMMGGMDEPHESDDQ